MRILLITVSRRIPVELKRYRVRHEFKGILMKSKNYVEKGRYLVRKTVKEEATGPHEKEEATASIRYLVRKRSSRRGRSGSKHLKRGVLPVAALLDSVKAWFSTFYMPFSYVNYLISKDTYCVTFGQIGLTSFNVYMVLSLISYSIQ
ncbi:hypothetical protein HN873_016501, partial [Arachis hypogaea]